MSISKYPKIRFKDENGNDYPDWEEKKLGEMFEIKKGIQISKKNLSLNGQKCILYGELFTRYDEIIEDVTSKTDLDVLPNSKYYDILMPSSDVTPNGLAKASCLLENDVILGGDMNILRYKDENVFPPFFSYQINYFKKKIMDVVSGTTIKHVYSKNIEKLNYEVPLCIDEQEKIASFFMLLDKRIEQQEQKIALLKDYEKAMMQKIFSQKIRFKDENGNDYPDWEEKKLGEIVYRNSKKNKDQKYTLIQSISNKYGFVNQEDYFEDRRVGSLDVSNYYVINNGCFAYNPSRIDVGSLAYKNDNDISIISPLYVSFKGNAKHINDKFLLGWLFSHKFVGKLGRLFEGSVRNTLSYENLSTIDIETPCIAEQEKIALFLEVINDSIENQKELLDEIIKEKTALLNKMFI